MRQTATWCQDYNVLLSDKKLNHDLEGETGAYTWFMF